MAGRPTKYLLPHGREGLTAGTYEQRLGALQTLDLRLTEQTAKPALVTLGTTVTTFYTQATAMRDFQGNRKAALDAGRVDLEAMRKLASGTLFAMVGTGMILWRTTPEMVDTLFDVNLLRNPAQTIPAPPADTAWDPATRTLSTTALPAGRRDWMRGAKAPAACPKASPSARATRSAWSSSPTSPSMPATSTSAG